MIHAGPRRLALAGLAACTLNPTAGLAQPATEPPEKPTIPAPAKSVDEVVVIGQSQLQDRVEIDRRSYALGKNLQAQTGTVADLLRTIPSVDVDVQGNVSLRGDQNVTITVDGKPAGEFNGAARATAVQSLPADRYERVEVIANPSAAERAEGSAGIINLVTKQARKAGSSGSAKIGVGERGQAVAGVNASYNSANLSLTGDVNLRGRDPGSGKVVEEIAASQTSVGSRTVDTYEGALSSAVGHLAADYDLDARTRIGARLQGVIARPRQTGDVLGTAEDGGGGGTEVTRQIYNVPVSVDIRLAGLSLRRKLGDEQEFTADLRTTRSGVRSRNHQDDQSIPPTAPALFDLSASTQVTDTTEFRADYKNPSLVNGEFKFGYDGAVTTSDLSKLFGAGPSPSVLAADPTRSGAFTYRLELNAAYATLQHGFGDLTVLAGLRLENSRTTTALSGGGAWRESALLQAFPSLHLSYPLGGDRTLSASYSRRIDRPLPAQLSPLITFGDPHDLYGGNPDLKPQETDAFEAAYDARRGTSSIAVTAYYRDLHHAFAPVVLDQGGGAVLFTQENVGEARKAGVSLAASRQLTPTITLNTSADAYWMEVPVSALVAGGARSGYVEEVRGTLSWSPAAKDVFQVNGSLSGRTVTPQGSLGAIGLVNLGYRRKVAPALFLFITVQNLLDSNRQTSDYNLPTLRDHRVVDGVGRSALVTLTYTFGAGVQKARGPAIDYSAGPQIPR
jgi:outer membrane receptor protein involved in Fe transport